jgi:hypothetical protein
VVGCSAGATSASLRRRATVDRRYTSRVARSWSASSRTSKAGMPRLAASGPASTVSKPIRSTREATVAHARTGSARGRLDFCQRSVDLARGHSTWPVADTVSNDLAPFAPVLWRRELPVKLSLTRHTDAIVAAVSARGFNRGRRRGVPVDRHDWAPWSGTRPGRARHLCPPPSRAHPASTDRPPHPPQSGQTGWPRGARIRVQPFRGGNVTFDVSVLCCEPEIPVPN